MTVSSVNNTKASPAVLRTNTTANPLEPELHGGKLLKNGSSGTDVKALQHLLNLHGAHLAEDGQFGPKTEAAVRGFQRSHGLAADGVVGSQTAHKLMAQPSSASFADHYASGGTQKVAPTYIHVITTPDKGKPIKGLTYV